MSNLTCSVYFTAADQCLYGHVTDAASLFEAVRLAWAWFQGTHWQGPRPTIETVFDVRVSSRGTYRVPAKQALEPKPLTPNQAPLFASAEGFEPSK